MHTIMVDYCVQVIKAIPNPFLQTDHTRRDRQNWTKQEQPFSSQQIFDQTRPGKAKKWSGQSFAYSTLGLVNTRAERNRSARYDLLAKVLANKYERRS